MKTVKEFDEYFIKNKDKSVPEIMKYFRQIKKEYEEEGRGNELGSTLIKSKGWEKWVNENSKEIFTIIEQEMEE